FLVSGKKITSAKTLKDYEEATKQMNFFRIHNGYIVNLKYIDKYIKGEGGFVVTSDNVTLEVSRRRKADLLEAIAKLK
ncbi:MAG: LytTR family transcriptional regulator, partial [Flavobacteriales bacterium]|nr:LytTR family transcriptional regulator [Flavobacteriales bacterium]